MVEYAVLLILLVTLFVGGTELGLTTLASNKNTEAAKTGISEYAEVNQQRLNILNAEKQYLTTLAGYGCSVIYEITNEYDDEANVYTDTSFSRTILSSDSNDFTCTKPSNEQITGGITFNSYDNFQIYIDEVFSTAASLELGRDSLESLADIYLFSLVKLHVGAAAECVADGDYSDIDWDIDNDCTLTEEEILAGIAFVNDDDDATDTEKKNNYEDAKNKFKYLMLASHIKLSKLPLNVSSTLSQASINIGDHDTGIVPAFCNGNTYSYGFPNGRYPYNNDDDDDTFVKTVGGQVYLFHPLPIDFDSCSGTDNTRGGRSRLRILIDGFGNATDADGDGVIDNPLFVPGMPKLNQAMYSNYENVCVDSANSYVSCSSANVSQRWLKPSGKICFNNTAASGEDSCIGQPNTGLEASDNTYGPTGFYFFANANNASTGSFEYTQNDSDRDNDGNVDFSPTLQLECSSTPNKDSHSVFDTNCTSLHAKVRIHTRYRRVFEGFLTFGLQTLTQPELLPYFYNPNQVGVAEHVVIGSHGSEVGPLGRGGNPTIKHFMDFRGCYEVDVETNQVSACN